MCILEHLNKSGVVSWLERQASTVPLLQHSSGATVSQWSMMWLETVDMCKVIFNVLCECDHDGMLWTELLKLMHTKAPSFWCVSTCATNPWLSYERFPESHSTTISCFTVLSKKNMICICFLSPVSFLSLFSSSHFNHQQWLL